MGGVKGARAAKRVLIDTCVWIYHFEGHREYSDRAGELLDRVESGRWHGIVSEISLLEILVKPLRKGDQDVADAYELILERFPHTEILPVTREVILKAAELRAGYGLKLPDAVILATGLNHGATLAVTQDRAWHRVDEIEVLRLDAR